MSGSIFVFALVISAAYAFFRFVEMRFVLKENRPLKILLKDALIVYLSVVTGHFIIEQVAPLKSIGGMPDVFTDDPKF